MTNFYKETRDDLYVKELQGSRSRLEHKSNNQTFFHVKNTVSEEVEYAVSQLNLNKLRG